MKLCCVAMCALVAVVTGAYQGSEYGQKRDLVELLDAMVKEKLQERQLEEQKRRLSEQKARHSATDISSRLLKGFLHRRNENQLPGDLEAADTDSDGLITQEDAYAVLAKYFSSFSEESLKAVINRLDKQNYGKVDAAELRSMYRYLKAKKEELMKKFGELDENQNDFLEEDELVDILIEEMNLGMFPSAAYDSISESDKDKDGKISKTEFIAMWSKLFG